MNGNLFLLHSGFMLPPDNDASNGRFHPSERAGTPSGPGDDKMIANFRRDKRKVEN